MLAKRVECRQKPVGDGRGLLILLLTIGLLGCPPAAAPPPLGGEGETCQLGAKIVRECEGLLRCVPRTYAVSQAPSGVHGPEMPSDIGGACGGIAGFHCAEGLQCEMSPEQAGTADALGVCVRVSRCVKP
jgi:hypothetical protein